ncbi:trypco2 family protein [Vibrio metschnikovii]|uniref:trypco2 family protein n=1 Tax=Vibrio metschnikovii TaxID=28172 RepID=UPI001C2F2840|nr:trypco2 family protein [Vibrio metschnikovii]
MNLEDFISQSLSQIARGIEKANKELEGSSAFVSPEGVKGVKCESKYGSLHYLSDTWLEVSEISFDVAVTATSGTESGGGLGVSVGGINIGAKGKSNHGDTSESRIQFSVPMVLPQARYVK